MKKSQVLSGKIKRQLIENLAVIPEIAGAAYGLSRNGSYDAVRRGDIKSKRMGRKIICPTEPILQDLGIERDETV